MELIQFIKERGLDSLVDRTKVNVVRHPEYANLVMLKYNQIESPMSDPLTRLCRGVILDEANDWHIVSRPYDKFFNHGEQHAARIDWSSAKIYEKLDGSLCTLYYYQGAWRVASSGHPAAAGNVHGNQARSFEDLFWHTWKINNYMLPSTDLQGEVCFMFELMTPENRIVVPHVDYRLVLHGARWLRRGVETAPNAWTSLGWDIVKTHDFGDLPSVLEAANTLRGLDSEGFVVRDNQFNRIKIKGKDYVALHRLRGQLASRRRLVEIILLNEGEEFLTYFPDLKDEFFKLKHAIQDLITQMQNMYAAHQHIESQKEFAEAVKHSPFSGALFSIRAGKVMSPEQWLRQCDARRVLMMLNLD